MSSIIEAKKSVIVSADVSDLDHLRELCKAVFGIPSIGGIKIGFRLSMYCGLQRAVSEIRQHLGEIPIIYDHQKAGTDIPDMGKGFAKDLKYAGVDAAILFPFAGPVTQEAWTYACQNNGLNVLTGGVMTHPKFLVSEGGYIADEAALQIYRNACLWAVRHFVVPGTKLHWVKKIRELLEEEIGAGHFTLYAPGFITQEGDITECGKVAGDEWHAIVGSAIYNQPNPSAMRQAAFAATSQIAA